MCRGDPSRPYHMFTDASDCGIGVVLVQDDFSDDVSDFRVILGPDDRPQPVHFFSALPMQA